MSPRSSRFRLQDILKAIEEVQLFTKSVTKEEFLKDRMRYHAVVRCLEVIGEASTHLPKEIQEKYSEIDWREVKGFRVMLAHKYFAIEDDIVWDAVKMDIEPLRIVIERILDSGIGED